MGAMLLTSASANADDGFKRLGGNEDVEFINTNVDENGKHIRGSYLTNPWYDNWSFTIMGGAQTIVSGTGDHNTGFDNHTAIVTPAVEIMVSKWFTPVIGFRAGFQGFWIEEQFGGKDYNHYALKRDGEDGRHITFNNTYLHGDVMWNFVNSFWGYRQNRFYNIVPYVNFGYMRLVHPEDNIFTGERRDREFEIGFGLNNTFRITPRLQAVLDLRWGNMDGRYHDVLNGGRVNHFSAQAGLAYSIEKWYFARSKGIEKQRDVAKTDAVTAMAALNEMMMDNEALQNDVQEVQAELEEARRISPDDFIQRVKAAGLILYYEINISKLNFTERNHLNDYVTETLENDPKHIFYLTGSADEGTGNFEINTRLSHERAEGVRNILIKEYNIPEDQVVIKATIISSQHEDGRLDRCVLLENE